MWMYSGQPAACPSPHKAHTGHLLLFCHWGDPARVFVSPEELLANQEKSQWPQWPGCPICCIHFYVFISMLSKYVEFIFRVFFLKEICSTLNMRLCFLLFMSWTEGTGRINCFDSLLVPCFYKELWTWVELAEGRQYN